MEVAAWREGRWALATPRALTYWTLVSSFFWVWRSRSLPVSSADGLHPVLSESVLMVTGAHRWVVGSTAGSDTGRGDPDVCLQESVYGEPIQVAERRDGEQARAP